VDAADVRLRNVTYRSFVDLGRAPAAAEVASALRVSVEEVEEGWRRLHDAHALVLERSTPALRMANPFSAVATEHRVRAAGRWWYANCAWDAFGICAALGADGLIQTSCVDCGEQIEVEVRDARPSDDSLLFHCLVPAERWWDDIVFT
jgi:hypothetical protein